MAHIDVAIETTTQCTLRIRKAGGHWPAPIVNPKHLTFDVAPGSYELVWTMTGNPGDKLKLSVSIGGVAKPAFEDQIPPGQSGGGGGMILVVP